MSNPKILYMVHTLKAIIKIKYWKQFQFLTESEIIYMDWQKSEHWTKSEIVLTVQSCLSVRIKLMA